MKTHTALALALFSAALLTSGGLFKVLHWPGASIQLVIGAPLQVFALIALSINVARGRGLKGSAN